MLVLHRLHLLESIISHLSEGKERMVPMPRWSPWDAAAALARLKRVFQGPEIPTPPKKPLTRTPPINTPSIVSIYFAQRPAKNETIAPTSFHHGAGNDESLFGTQGHEKSVLCASLQHRPRCPSSRCQSLTNPSPPTCPKLACVRDCGECNRGTKYVDKGRDLADTPDSSHGAGFRRGTSEMLGLGPLLTCIHRAPFTDVSTSHQQSNYVPS